jgi:hypothetical protein
MTHFSRPRTDTAAFLPHLAAATGLLVIDLVPRQDLQSDPEFASGGDSGFTQSLLCQLGPVEALELRVSAYRVYGCLALEKAQQWVALLAHSPRCFANTPISLMVRPFTPAQSGHQLPRVTFVASAFQRWPTAHCLSRGIS